MWLCVASSNDDLGMNGLISEEKICMVMGML